MHGKISLSAWLSAPFVGLLYFAAAGSQLRNAPDERARNWKWDARDPICRRLIRLFHFQYSSRCACNAQGQFRKIIPFAACLLLAWKNDNFVCFGPDDFWISIYLLFLGICGSNYNKEQDVLPAPLKIIPNPKKSYFLPHVYSCMIFYLLFCECIMTKSVVLTHAAQRHVSFCINKGGSGCAMARLSIFAHHLPHKCDRMTWIEYHARRASFRFPRKMLPGYTRLVVYPWLNLRQV